MGGAGEKEKQRVRKKVKGKSVGGTKTEQAMDRVMEREAAPAGPARGEGNEETGEKDRMDWMK
ncbi:hypothetical protein K0M31_017953 [Melipona bicolor]|uniref:Uncharacterized protein n=1 Tax=Melipona bicolor TaxID=60889 RepID=A0AA40G6B3_9HYME|nr:hypothetical protein K0M31_017953 [Melipona bicolor]